MLGLRRPAEVCQPLLFYAVVAALFPLGISPDPARLAEAAPGMLWVAALLAALLAGEGMFRRDFEDGVLEQTILAPQPLFLAVLAAPLAHWLLVGLPLSLLAPVCAILLQLPLNALPALAISMLLGTAVLSLIGSIGAALTLGLRPGGLLLALLILPLQVPVLIFGSGAARLAASGGDPAPPLLLLAAMLCLALALAPFAAAAGLRLAVEAE